MIAVGVLLTEGLGVEANEHEGIEWLRRGCAAGSTQGLYELGIALDLQQWSLNQHWCLRSPQLL